MKQITVVVVSLATLAVAFTSYWIGQDRGSQRSKVGAEFIESSEENSSQGASRGRLEMRLAALEASRWSSEDSSGQEAPAMDDVQSKKDNDPFDPDLMVQRDLKRAQAIDEALKRETVDRAWAFAAESEIRSAVDLATKEDNVQFSVQSLGCLTSICEMVLSAPSIDQLQGSGLHLIHRISGMGSVDIKPTETLANGTASATLRFYREGYERPDAGIM